ncbi:hypothetical protein TWF281_010546 [Arthrobotrys megalospora]
MSTANLDSLPIDIKFIIINFLPDLYGFRALCHVCPSYHSVYKAREIILEPSLLYNDAISKYPRECLWLARHHNKLHNIDRAVNAMLEYIIYPNKAPKTLQFISQLDTYGYYNDNSQEVAAEIKHIKTSETHKTPQNFLACGKDKREIARTHKAIVDIYKRLVGSKLPNPRRGAPLSEIPPSADEERRIMEAIYRFFIGISYTFRGRPGAMGILGNDGGQGRSRLLAQRILDH